MDARFTTVRVCNGHFDVYWKGQKTEWTIVNGSQGMSGHGRNMYGIVKGDLDSPTNPGTVRWLGPLVTCKKVLAATLRKQEDGQ